MTTRALAGELLALALELGLDAGAVVALLSDAAPRVPAAAAGAAADDLHERRRFGVLEAGAACRRSRQVVHQLQHERLEQLPPVVTRGHRRCVRTPARAPARRPDA